MLIEASVEEPPAEEDSGEADSLDESAEDADLIPDEG